MSNANIEEQSESGWRFWRLPLATLAIVFIVWLLAGHIPFWVFGSAKLEDAARYGDTFGFANSLFSGLAFAGVIVAIVLQTRELRLQRQELHETRDELNRAATAQEETEKALILTAYLNALSVIREGYALEATQEDENSRIRPAQRAHTEIMVELAAMVEQQRSLVHSRFSVPDRFQRVRRSILTLLQIANEEWEVATRVHNEHLDVRHDGPHAGELILLSIATRLRGFHEVLSRNEPEGSLKSKISSWIDDCHKLRRDAPAVPIHGDFGAAPSQSSKEQYEVDATAFWLNGRMLLAHLEAQVR